jgi:hypothetical protein
LTEAPRFHVGKHIQVAEEADQDHDYRGDSGDKSTYHHNALSFPLLGFSVRGVLPAETAVFAHFQSVRIVLLVFHRVVVALLAFGASQSDFYAHNGTSRYSEFLTDCVGR